MTLIVFTAAMANILLNLRQTLIRSLNSKLIQNGFDPSKIASHKRNLMILGSPISSTNTLHFVQQQQQPPPQQQQIRKLYSDEVLGVDRFVQYREQVNQRFGQQKQVFIQRLEEHIKDDKSAILSEDLKNLIFLAETPEHIELLQKAIDKFEKQNESLRFGLFQFGPVVMRLAKHLNNVQMAMWIFNPKYRQFFSQLSSVTIAMDILFENHYYQECIQLFDLATTKFDFDVKYPVDFVVLYFAASYKLNTVDSFEASFRLLRSMQMSQNQAKLRGMYFFLALAIKQNHPNIALEIIQGFNFKSINIVLQSLRLLANAKINRFHDVMEILQFYLKKDKALMKNKIIFKDTLDEIVKLFNDSNKEEFIKKMQMLVKNLEESKLIETERTLEQALLEPITYTRRKARSDGMENVQDSRPVARQNQRY